jgi:hypothetical protein
VSRQRKRKKVKVSFRPTMQAALHIIEELVRVADGAFTSKATTAALSADRRLRRRGMAHRAVDYPRSGDSAQKRHPGGSDPTVEVVSATPELGF